MILYIYIYIHRYHFKKKNENVFLKEKIMQKKGGVKASQHITNNILV